jgi:prepilin-type N-terminal cleavage/methylation domain-containing protein
MSARDPRSGFTIAELLVTLVLLGIVCGAVVATLQRQQRFYRDAADVIDTRQQVRQAIALVPAELRGISTIGGDILAMSDSALDIRANVGSAVVCAHSVGEIAIPPVARDTGSALTSFISRPVVGDLAIVFDDSAPGVAGDRWHTHTIARVDSTTDRCSMLADAGNGTSAYGYTFTVAPNLSSTLRDGAPVRFARRSNYTIYRSSSDGRWWLGYRECAGDGSSCGGIQPVSGPYRPYAPNDTLESGISFVYRDSIGRTTSTSTAVARIEMFAIGETRGAIARQGAPPAARREVMKVTVAIRNRR